jgi:hypothetical protein
MDRITRFIMKLQPALQYGAVYKNRRQHRADERGSEAKTGGRMKYWCEHCKTEIKTEYPPPFACPMCIDKVGDYGFLPTIPEYETVAEWEKRRGEKYPATAPVYARMKGYEHLASWLCEIQIIAERDESMCEPFVVATEAGEPPDDWKAEKP